MNVSPYHFELKLVCSGKQIIYEQLREISQGGPLVGTLNIEGNKLGKDRKIEFGGPAVCFDNYLIVPYYSRFRFRLSAVEVTTGGIKLCRKTEELILIKDIANGEINYYTDLQNSELCSCPLHELLNINDVFFSKKKSFWRSLKFWR